MRGYLGRHPGYPRFSLRRSAVEASGGSSNGSVSCTDAAASLPIGVRCRVIFGAHASGHDAAFVFRDNDFVGAGVAHGLGVAGLSGTGDDARLGIEGLGGDGDVEIVCVVVDHDADTTGALDAGSLENNKSFGVALDDENPVLEQLAAYAFVGFNEAERNLQAEELVYFGPAGPSGAGHDEVDAAFVDDAVVYHRSPRAPQLAACKDGSA